MISLRASCVQVVNHCVKMPCLAPVSNVRSIRCLTRVTRLRRNVCMRADDDKVTREYNEGSDKVTEGTAKGKKGAMNPDGTYYIDELPVGLQNFQLVLVCLQCCRKLGSPACVSRSTSEPQAVQQVPEALACLPSAPAWLLQLPATVVHQVPGRISRTSDARAQWAVAHLLVARTQCLPCSCASGDGHLRSCTSHIVWLTRRRSCSGKET